jgi:lipid-A-disaccharide synthase
MTAPREAEAPLVFIVAGEASGDQIGAHLIAALRRLTDGAVRVAGVGGPRMAALGFESLFPIAEIAVMGYVELIPHVPRVIRRLRETTRAALASRPAIVVSIDSPAFSLRVQERLAGLGAPRVHIVAPQVWAYRPERAAKLPGMVDHLLHLLPFEAPYFERYGLACTFIGHPILEEGIAEGDGTGFRARHGIASEAPLLVLLPGSRRSETKRLLPIYLETARRLSLRHAGLRTVLLAVPHLAAALRAQVARRGAAVTVVEGRAEKAGAFAAGTVALAASGSVTIELAIAGLPMVVGYRMNPLTAAMARRLVRVPFVTLANLVVGERVAPEFLLDACTPERLVPALDQLLVDEAARRAQIESFRSVARALRPEGGPPSERAAQVILSLIAARRSATA